MTRWLWVLYLLPRSLPSLSPSLFTIPSSLRVVNLHDKALYNASDAHLPCPLIWQSSCPASGRCHSVYLMCIRTAFVWLYVRMQDQKHLGSTQQGLEPIITGSLWARSYFWLFFSFFILFIGAYIAILRVGGI